MFMLSAFASSRSPLSILLASMFISSPEVSTTFAASVFSKALFSFKASLELRSTLFFSPPHEDFLLKCSSPSLYSLATMFKSPSFAFTTMFSFAFNSPASMVALLFAFMSISLASSLAEFTLSL